MLDLLLPRRCLACGHPGVLLCPSCLGALPRISAPLCERCGAPTAWPVARCRECAGRRLAFGRARAAVAYDETVRRLVSAWKERGLRGLAAPAADVVVGAVPRPDADALAAVPPDRARALKRGHHPAAALAAELSSRWRIPSLALLERAATGPRQRGLTLAERRRNVREAFRAAGDPPRRIVLVDDVYTTGATADAAARALRRGGSERVEVVAFARTIRAR